MLRRVTIFISLLTIGVILFASQTYAASNTFSVYGHVQYDNGSSIPGTTIRMINPMQNTTGVFVYNAPTVQSTLTDNNGNFQFINVTSNYSVLGLVIEYPSSPPTNPPYIYLSSDGVNINTSGIQYVNITRKPVYAPNPELNDATPSPNTQITIIIFGLVGLFIIRQNKK
jgi:hypothetical protein